MPKVQGLFQRRPLLLAVDGSPEIKECCDGPQVVDSGGRNERTAQLGAMVGKQLDHLLQPVDRRHREHQALEQRGMAAPGTCRRQVGLRDQDRGQAVEITGGQRSLRRVIPWVHVHERDPP